MNHNPVLTSLAASPLASPPWMLPSYVSLHFLLFLGQLLTCALCQLFPTTELFLAPPWTIPPRSAYLCPGLDLHVLLLKYQIV